MRIRQVKTLVGGEILAEPVITEEKESTDFQGNGAQTGISGFNIIFRH